MRGGLYKLDQPSTFGNTQSIGGNVIENAIGIAPTLVDNANTYNFFCNQEGTCLSDILQAKLRKIAPSEKSLACADNALKELRMAVSQLGPEWDVESFGSFANGFGTLSSDLDVTCLQRENLLGSDGQVESVHALHTMAQTLEMHPDFTVLERIFGARVPILKLRYANQLDIDLSCHNPIPLLNTRLLRAYSRIDSRVRDLGVLVKIWARSAGVCDATKSHLSSYSFTLLVIYFMQVHEDVRLPVLPVEAFSDQGCQEADERIIAATSSWWCGLSLADLMTRFFAFYCNANSDGFRWGEEVVTVRCGERHLIFESMFSRLRGRHVQRLHVEDPYQLERNLHGVLGDVEEDQLYKAFWGALHELLQMPRVLAKRTNSLVVGGHVDPVAVGHAGNTAAPMIKLVEQHKSAPTIESNGESTDSGGTAQEPGSDSESCDDSFDTLEVCAIPWPGKLCPDLPVQRGEGVESDKGYANVARKADRCSITAYGLPQLAQCVGADWNDHVLPQITNGSDYMNSIWSGTMITESL